MKFIRYLENQYQEVQWRINELNAKNEFSAWMDAETKAIHSVLTTSRSFMKWCHVPLVFVGFFMVKLGLKAAPEPVMVNQLKARQTKELQEKSKKIGMQSFEREIPANVQ